MNFSAVFDNLGFLLEASWLTIYLSFISFIIALFLGVVVGTLRSYKIHWLLNLFLSSYIEIFRGTPLLIQLFFIYYGLPQVGISMSSHEAAIIGLSLNFGAYMSEIVRAGIQGVDKGQAEAAKSLGMNNLQILVYIIYPQALKLSLPSLTNTYAAILKDSSLVSVLSITELTRAGQLIYVRTYEPFEIYLTLGVFYFVMTYTISVISKKIEKRLNYN
ncbi:amino acid ABC transporter permease [Halarcobacter bivalviorum]|uniref:Putative glutamine transport system permease protein GlnP n=1 Tax=Halarcobacter bivalviorum TaxID=663364 RepID=A0AAX2ADP4_9BACT|nr:amino acid ABC transporter permease [Halarcobacter bivalviorum]AXH11743.1 amino acid ABC transporter, permease protein [Halarcobacter bivalviorum]RXK10871.1 amino acid ABC transporter permease [Halarcobacter bivalviorum]